MDERTRKILRTAQTRFAWLPDAKALGQRCTRRALRRPFENDFRAVPLLRLPPHATCLDIGANRGQSIDALHLYTDDATIHSFEPNRLLADRLGRRFRHADSVTVHNVALGDERGTYKLYVPIYRGYIFDGLASLDEESAREWLRDRIYRFDESRLRVDVLDCTVVLLDDLQLAPALLKIDVQGYELQVLRGAQQTLRLHHPALLIEAPGEVITTYLRALGYEPYQYMEGSLVPGEQGMLNTFFLSHRHGRLSAS